MATTPVRLWIAGGMAVSVLLAVAGWAFVVSPQRAAAAEDRTTLAETQVANATVQARSDVLAVELKDIDDRRTALAVKQALLPAVNGLDGLLVALNAAAAAAGVVVEDVTAGGPVDLDAGPAAPAPAAPDPGAASTGTEQGGGAGTGAAPGAANGPAPPEPRCTPLPVTVRVSGPVAAIETFLSLVQAESRAILFTSVGLVPITGTLGDGAVMTAETQVFVRPAAISAAATAP